MACAPELMKAEQGLFDVLPRIASYRLTDGVLSMADKDGREVLRLVPAR
jgi:putative lipoprotein